jgi:large subunit ribosomal protein L25
MNLTAHKREIIGKQVRQLRREQSVPAVAFGPTLESTSIQIDYKEFAKVFKDAGHSKLINLELDGQKLKAIIKEVQINPVSRFFIHASIYTVAMDRELEAEIPLELIGLAPAVKNNLGFLEVPANVVTVRCLPADLPAKIEVDVTKLENVGDAVTVADLGLGDKVKIQGDTDGSLKVAYISAPQKIEEEEEVVAAVEGEEGAAEGEAAAATEETEAKE